MFARSSTVGTLMMGSTMGGAAGIGFAITADCKADVVSPVRTGLRATRRGAAGIDAGAGSPPGRADGLGLDLATNGSGAGSITGFEGFLASGLAALAVSLSVSPKIFVIELLRPLPAPVPMAAPAA